MKMYLSFLENRALISYQKEGGIYRTTYKGRQFLRAYNDVEAS
jgi:predicted transcriptional regulator